ncbi:MAG: CxxC-x17-CxxC domain-containing protein [Candidatus Bathyarchaeia archaeon]
MFKATCAECGKSCELPFKPDGTRPVFCRECYSKRRHVGRGLRHFADQKDAAWAHP